jgi:hypothetical protein
VIGAILMGFLAFRIFGRFDQIINNIMQREGEAITAPLQRAGAVGFPVVIMLLSVLISVSHCWSSVEIP